MNKKLTKKEIEELLNKYDFKWEYIFNNRYNSSFISIKLNNELNVDLYYIGCKFHANYVVNEFKSNQIKEIIRCFVLSSFYPPNEFMRIDYVSVFDILNNIVSDKFLDLDKERLGLEFDAAISKKTMNEILKYRNDLIDNVSYLTDTQKDFIKYDVRKKG